MELLHERETEQAIGLIFEVRNQMGGGWSEEIYHQALVENFREHGIPTLQKPRRSLIHRGVEIYVFEPDIIAWDKVIFELKVLPDFKGKDFPSRNYAQTIHYLKLFEKNLGMLINFAHSKVGIKRLAYEPPEMEIYEDYDRIRSHLSDSDRQILLKVRQIILNLGKRYETGYSEIVYRKIIAVELAHHGIKCISDVNITAQWKGKRVGNQTTQHMFVEDRFLLLVRATLDAPPTYDYIKTRTYLKALGIKVGLVINFGRNELQIIGTEIR